MLPLREVLPLGSEGVMYGLVVGADCSDIGGDGGVGVSDTPEDDVLGGGVSKEASVVVGESSERGEADTAEGSMESVLLLRARDCSALWSLSLMMSASILRSDSSSFNLWASMRRCSRSCSPVLTSSSSMTLRSIF